MSKIDVLDGDVIVSVSAIMDILEVSSKSSIANYVKKGMPFVPYGKQKSYKVKECLAWAYKNGVLFLELNPNMDIDVEELAPSIRKDLADARLKELKLQKEKDEVVLKTDVINDAVSFGIALRDNLMSIPSRVSSTTANETNPKEIIKILNTELRQSLEDVTSEFMKI